MQVTEFSKQQMFCGNRRPIPKLARQNSVLNTVFKEHKSQERRRPQCSLFVCFRDNLPTEDAQYYTPSRGPCVPVARLLFA